MLHKTIKDFSDDETILNNCTIMHTCMCVLYMQAHLAVEKNMYHKLPIVLTLYVTYKFQAFRTV